MLCVVVLDIVDVQGSVHLYILRKKLYPCW